jgi:hypothetical protein
VRQSVALATTALLCASLATAARAAYNARPPLAHTGGFDEKTCRECHFDGPTSSPGTVALGGVPERYRRGAVYRLEVVIRDNSAQLGGFQLAARVAAGPHAGTQAGMLCAMDTRVAVAADSTTGVQYASHAGAAPADSLRWQLEWRAPGEDVGSVIFHVAANSANDDGSQLGDVILLTSRETRPIETGIRGQGSGGVRIWVRRGTEPARSPDTSDPTPPDP